MPMSVRPAVPADAAEFARLTDQLGYDADGPTVEKRLVRLLSRADHRVLVAEVDGRVAGWLHAISSDWIDSDSCVVIGGLVVDKEHRRAGIGRVLMQHAEAWAHEIGCPYVRLWSTDTRKAAHEFYKAIGYTHIKTHFSFVKALDLSKAKNLKNLVPRVDE